MVFVLSHIGSVVAPCKHKYSPRSQHRGRLQLHGILGLKIKFLLSVSSRSSIFFKNLKSLKNHKCEPVLQCDWFKTIKMLNCGEIMLMIIIENSGNPLALIQDHITQQVTGYSNMSRKLLILKIEIVTYIIRLFFRSLHVLKYCVHRLKN